MRFIDIFDREITGVFVGVILCAIPLSFVFCWRYDRFRDEAVDRGYAEYVIKNREIVWQWKEAQS